MFSSHRHILHLLTHLVGKSAVAEQEFFPLHNITGFANLFHARFSQMGQSLHLRGMMYNEFFFAMYNIIIWPAVPFLRP